MLEQIIKLPVSVWTPRTVGFMTFLLMPGGWLLGTLNFYRMGLQRQAWGHLIALFVGTLLLIALAFFSPGQMPSATGLMLGILLGSYMYTMTGKAIADYRAAGGVVHDANVWSGFFISLGAAFVWFLSCLALAFAGVLLQALVAGEF